MKQQEISTQGFSPPSPHLPTPTPLQVVRDRDYLLDRHGIVFKVIGDVHPEGHYLGYVKYYPDALGERSLNGENYTVNSVVSKSFGVLADRPECYIYSPVVGSVITAVPRQDVAVHFSARHRLQAISDGTDSYTRNATVKDLRSICDALAEQDALKHFGVTGSFLVGCPTNASDIDLVCYGAEGYLYATQLFADRSLITPYEGSGLRTLYKRRAKYLQGSSFDALIRQENRKLQGLTSSGAHINCEPLREDSDALFTRMTAKEIGDITLLAIITDHTQGVATPALYTINVETILHSTIDEPERFISKITALRSYLGAYTGAFREGDTVHITGKLVHLRNGDHTTFGVELTPWTVSTSYLANLAR